MKITISILLIYFLSLPISSTSQVYGEGVIDVDGNFYESVIIGNQEWIASNLRTTKYSNGDVIENLITDSLWASTNQGAWSYFQNNISFDSLYGKVYNQYTVMDERNVCPTGWHVPKKSEWLLLEDYLGGSDVAGGKLKKEGTLFWFSPNVDATNETGFSGYPSGSRFFNGGFPISILSTYAVWWSATSDGSFNYWYADINSYSGSIAYGLGSLRGGINIRCLKDNNLNIYNNNLIEELTLFPNPTKENIYVSFTQETFGIEYTLFDIHGKEIITNQLIENIISLSKLEAGVYYIKFTKDETIISTKKIIKN